MTLPGEHKRVEVSHRIEAPAALIFTILSDPRRHVDFDGSGMLRGAIEDRPISGVGDTFTMMMLRLGDDYRMLNYVVEFEPDRRIFWTPLLATHPEPRATILPMSASPPGTAGATSSRRTATTPRWSPRYSISAPYQTTSSTTAEPGSTAPIQ